MYRLLILLAFWDNDDFYDKVYNQTGGDVFGGDPARYGDFGKYTWRENRSFDIPLILRPLGRDYVPLTKDERRALQSSVLKCKWCTNNRIRAQLPDLGRLIMSRWCINAGYIFENEKESQKVEKMLSSDKAREDYECVVVRVNKKTSVGMQEGKKDKCPFCYMTIKPGEFVEFGFEGAKRKDSSWFLFPEDPKPIVLLRFSLLSMLEVPPHLFGPENLASWRTL